MDSLEADLVKNCDTLAPNIRDRELRKKVNLERKKIKNFYILKKKKKVKYEIIVCFFKNIVIRYFHSTGLLTT